MGGWPRCHPEPYRAACTHARVRYANCAETNVSQYYGRRMAASSRADWVQGQRELLNETLTQKLTKKQVRGQGSPAPCHVTSLGPWSWAHGNLVRVQKVEGFPAT